MSDFDYERELASEQCFASKAYALVDAELAAATATLSRLREEADSGRVPSTLIEQEIARASAMQRRHETREAGSGPVCFGRLDFEDHTVYIGRRGLQDSNRDPVVIDWRTRAAAAFYRATPSDPQGVVRRRHLEITDRTVVNLNDELLDIDSSLLAERSVEIVGEGALLAALRSPRGTHMRDIVATIQAEQDHAVRAPVRRCLTIQGGPGTGKTAVALHRLAYLLYERKLLGESVLVVGPSADFVRYIRKVLPSLGAQDAALVTVPGIYFGNRRLRPEDEVVATLKGDRRMARVVRRSVQLLVRRSSDDLEVPWGVYVVRLAGSKVQATQDLVRRRRLPHNAGRQAFVEELLPAMWEAAKAQVNPFGKYWAKQWTKAEFKWRLEASDHFQTAVDERWPEVTSSQLVGRLYRSRAWLTAASRGILLPAEVELLLEAGGQRGWTEADAAILDEARALLGSDIGDGTSLDRSSLRRHALAAIDEAQELSPMAWRMVRRRTIGSGLTIVGDIAQGTSPWAARSWDEIARRAAVEQRTNVEVGIGYRAPDEVMEVAAAVLAHVDTEMAAPSSVRSSGNATIVERHDEGDLVDAALAVAERSLQDQAGTVAVIAPESLLAAFRSGAHPVAAEQSARLSILSANASKGLEFDTVVVVEPASIVRSHDRGWQQLYVAVTRALGQLVVVHHQALPWTTGAGDGAAPASLVSATPPRES